MGGCRCTYKNCNVKTDRKTHMFHYPVFDKRRCHQWLLNANKLEFLNLKLSQLKNRVICQHHFKDDNFMNYKKNKLKFDAVPDQDWPICGSSQFSNTNEDNIETFPLILEDIENENMLSCDKKANYSVKYGDFLTNSEIYFVSSLDTNNINLNYSQENENHQSFKNEKNTTQASSGLKNTHNMERYSNKLVFQPDTTSSLVIPMQPTVTKSHDVIQDSEKTTLQETTSNINPEISLTKQLVDNIPIAQDMQKKKEHKVKIISLKKVKDPFIMPENLRPVSPSLVIEIPQKKFQKGNHFPSVLPTQPLLNTFENVNKFPTENYSVEMEFKSEQEQENTALIVKKDIVNDSKHSSQLSPKKELCNPQLNSEKPKVSLLKNKISSKRIAAIQQKRKFNMKLRDMIETCLDKRSHIKDDEQQSVNLRDETNEHENNRLKDTQVGLYLTKKPDLPSAQEYTIAYLDARMKRLENTLLNKIDQNSQKIIELKNSITQTPSKKTNTTVQTHDNDESYKKHLYQEISKFLSPASKSLVYEELFINKYFITNDNTGVKRKRRKFR